MKSLAKSLSEFVSDLSFDKVPEEVKHQSERILMDTIGVILAGSQYSLAGKILKNLLLDWQEIPEATLAGTCIRKSERTAAMANAMMAHSLELDDGSKYATYHPASSIVPTVLAVGEKGGLSPVDVLEAIIAGYEVSLRIGTSINPSHYLKGFHPTGTVATFGTTTAACKLMKMSPEEIAHALGLAGSLASGINQYEVDGSIVKHLHPGNAASNGILAAKLAKGGFTGPEGVIEGRLGFCHCFSDEFDMDRVLKGLGSSYEILTTYFKPYCSCRYVHYAIEATENALNGFDDRLKPEDISAIRVRTHRNAKQGSDNAEYMTPLHARLSLQYGIGSIVVRGHAGLVDYTEEALKDQTVRSIARKTTVHVDPEIQKVYPNPRSMIVEIETVSGLRSESRIDHAKGDMENPMTDQELCMKLEDITKGVVSEKRMKEIEDIALQARQMQEISSITRLLKAE